MKTSTFKTNIKCSACVDKVTPHLNEGVGAGNWQVDLTDPQRKLSVSAEVTEAQVNDILNKAGYKAEKLSA